MRDPLVPTTPLQLMGRTYLDSYAGRRLLGIGLIVLSGLILAALPQHSASAQVPPVDQCVQNPQSCLPDAPDAPDPDPCIQNPQSCLPEPPPVDQCAQDPQSCLPAAPPVDQCAQNPQSCLPGETPRVDQCVSDPGSCLSGGPDEEQPDGTGEDDDGPGSAVPGRKKGTPSGPGGSASQREGPAGFVTLDPVAEVAPDDQSPVASALGGPDGSALEQLGRGLADAARRFAFPLGIAALVAAFLVVQGRFDRREPKLAAAPVDSRDDLVIYR